MRKAISDFISSNLEYIHKTTQAALHFLPKDCPDIVPETVCFYKYGDKFEMVAWFSSESDLLRAADFYGYAYTAEPEDHKGKDVLCWHISSGNDTLRLYYKLVPDND